eukprot:8617664-Alexandrium_andersonii.AAC.1
MSARATSGTPQAQWRGTKSAGNCRKAVSRSSLRFPALACAASPGGPPPPRTPSPSSASGARRRR